MEKCKFCELLLGMLERKEEPFNTMTPEQREANKCNLFKPVVGYVRGFPLCANHVNTIKRDNKYRISKGIDVPDTLETLRLLNGDF
jgi:hypothetical protein